MTRRVFEGALELVEDEMTAEWRLEPESMHANTTDFDWFTGLAGKRVRITVEVLDDTGPKEEP